MKIRTFIDRPILAGVISALILILGIISLVQLPVEQFPEIAPPTVSVQANYTGANAETVLKSVVVPLEEALNGVENMMYMTSSATNAGMANIRIYFRQGTDPDMATVNVQNRIASAQGCFQPRSHEAVLRYVNAKPVISKLWLCTVRIILSMRNS